MSFLPQRRLHVNVILHALSEYSSHTTSFIPLHKIRKCFHSRNVIFLMQPSQTKWFDRWFKSRTVKSSLPLNTRGGEKLCGPPNQAVATNCKFFSVFILTLRYEWDFYIFVSNFFHNLKSAEIEKRIRKVGEDGLVCVPGRYYEGQYANPFTPTEILIVVFHSSTSITVLTFCGSIYKPIEVITKLWYIPSDNYLLKLRTKNCDLLSTGSGCILQCVGTPYYIIWHRSGS